MLAFFDRDREGVQSQLFINGINFSYIITEIYVQILASADIEGGGGSHLWQLQILYLMRYIAQFVTEFYYH